MSRIRILPDHVANQIAAGEVIERPVAVVKELVENSLDAGATRVEVDFMHGGRSLIRIEDNGFGMSPDEALMSLERHATSKIRSAEDLNTIRSFGFRGEALPSVASVSRFTLRSRRPEDAGGSEILVNGGKMIHQKACGMPQGTVIEVAHLFNSVPARRKFLKTDKTEAAHIIQCVRLFALAHPKVSFSLKEEGRQVFRSPSCKHLMERIAEVWSRSLVSELIEFSDYSSEGVNVTGVIMRPGTGRSSRNDLQCFVNSRPVDSRTLTYAVLESYHTHIPRGRFPAAFLFIDLDPACVDVNVHPSKREVRFRDESLVRRAIVRLVTATLSGSHASISQELPETLPPALPLPPPDSTPSPPALHVTIPVKQRTPSDPAKKMASALLAEKYPPRISGSTPPHQTTSPTSSPTLTFSPSTSVPHPTPPIVTLSKPAEFPQPSQQTPWQVSPTVPTVVQPPALIFDWLYIGLFRKPVLFALFESKNGLVLLNCRAAHERIAYERLCKQFAAENIISQPLLIPQTIELDAIASAHLEPHLDYLTKLGLEIAPFGKHFFRIESLPQDLDPRLAEKIVRDIADGLRDGRISLTNRSLAYEKIAIIASSRALRNDDNPNEEKIKALARQLLTCNQPLTCPRGRPTLHEMSLNELIRKFSLSN